MTASASWVLLEPYVFRRDDDDSFPDDTVAPIKACGTTDWGAKFRIAFSLADPPSISRLYAQLPGFPDPLVANPLDMVATHRDHALLVIGTKPPSEGPPSEGLLYQNYFIFKLNENNPCSSSLIALPPCTERKYDFRRDLRRHRNKPSSNAPPRLLNATSSGLWCSGDNKGQEEFVVAELTIFVPTLDHIRTKAFADICLLRSSFTDDLLHSRKWETKRVEILSTTDDDLWKLSRWHTHAVIPFQRWLCWISYHHGILFCDVSEKVPAPRVSFFWFPPDVYSLSSTFQTPCSGNGGVSVVDRGQSLKFVYVARHDRGPAYGALQPGTGFTITCHTLMVLHGGGSMEWKLDYTVTSDQLPDCFRRGLPMFPRVDIDRPHVVHFLFVEFEKAHAKMSVLSIDMNRKYVESCCLYFDKNELDQAEDVYFNVLKRYSPTPRPFLSCEFPRFCNLSRKRKDME